MAIDPRGTFREIIRANEEKSCNHCHTRHRLGISRLCAPCTKKFFSLGHCDAKIIRPRKLRPCLEMAIRITGRNLTHPAVEGFQLFYTRWIEEAHKYEDVPGSKVMKLRTPEQWRDTLNLALAVFAYSKDGSCTEIPDGRCCMYQIWKHSFRYNCQLDKSWTIYQPVTQVENRRAVDFLTQHTAKILITLHAALEMEKNAELLAVNLYESEPMAMPNNPVLMLLQKRAELEKAKKALKAGVGYELT